MKTLRTTLAVMLVGLAFTAFESDALAQARRGGSSTSKSSSTSRSSSVSRSSSSPKSISASTSRSDVRPSTKNSSDRKPGVTTGRKPSTTVTAPSKPATTVTAPSGQRPSSQKPVTVTRPASQKPSSTKPSTVTRPASQKPSVTKPSTQKPSVTRPATKPTVTRPATQKPSGQQPDFKPGDQNKPITVTRPGHRPGDRKPSKSQQIRPDHKPDVHRVHPRDRDFMHYDRPSYYWSGHNHYYGHRVRVIPTHALIHVHHGITYYCYNDIWYRPYGGHYVVCRPPFGTVLAANLIADMTWAAVNMSYYYTVAQTYSQISENNAYIAEQNAIIAQNNATIAAQNAQIAAGQMQAQAAYTLANQLGLVQSYAAAGSTYYYQDGVFYMMGADGQYSVIVPPAGALVETLPEDYDVVVLADGNEYYQVDDTVYKVTISEGKPYFEVLGQRY